LVDQQQLTLHGHWFGIKYGSEFKIIGRLCDMLCKTIYLNFVHIILPAALGPGVYSASNRNEYQKHQNNNVSGE
jgi:hypothetical protein